MPRRQRLLYERHPDLPDVPKTAILIPHKLLLDPETLAPALRSC
jgi:hypothetical protein